MTEYLAPDIFCIERRQSKIREYRATFPCGTAWEFDRLDLEIPAFEDGEQTGVTHSYRTVREAIADLRAIGCNVQLIKDGVINE